MADELQEQQIQQPAVSAEVAQMMELSLNGGMPQTLAAEAVIETPPAEQEQIIDANEYLKTTLGFDSWEDAKTQIEGWKQKAAAPEPFKFENEASEKLAKAFLSGKTDEVYQYLDEQRKLDKYLSADVTEDLADEIIKMGLKVSHKDLSDAEINFKFNKQYGLPKEPVELASESAEDFEERHNAWKEQVADIKMSKIIDAKLARPQLETAKSKLVLPEITATVDQDYIQWQKLMEEQSKLDAQISEEYKTITPKDVEFKMPFNDEANKIAFEFQYEPDVEGLKKSTDLASNIDNLLGSYISNGKFDKQAFLRDIHFGRNKEAILLTAMNQAKNATIKASLPNNNDGSGLNRQQPALEQATELQKQMQNSLAPFQRN